MLNPSIDQRRRELIADDGPEATGIPYDNAIDFHDLVVAPAGLAGFGAAIVTQVAVDEGPDLEELAHEIDPELRGGLLSWRQLNDGEQRP